MDCILLIEALFRFLSDYDNFSIGTQISTIEFASSPLKRSS